VAGIRFPDLVERFTVTLERAGATVLIVGQNQTRPTRLRIITGETTTDCLVFLWTITPGGGGAGVRPANERRIQITNAQGFPLNPGIRTIVGGWSPDEGVWAFWDARRHSTFSRRSPSLQTNLQTLEAAGQEGLATQVRPVAQGREVVVAVSAESLLWYVQEGERLHNADVEAEHVTELLDATPEVEREIIDSSQSSDEAARRYELVQTMRAFRDARFRPAVLRAYSYHCAVCGIACKLVDAAHIVPVFHPKGTDEVTNGIALCRLHHAAYDAGLLGVCSDYRVILNVEAAARLRDAQLDGGLEEFHEALPRMIRVPASIEVRPDPGKLRLGLEVRQFPALLIA
jgi:putative restriction endonuclease